MRKTLTIDVDAELLRQLELKAKQDGRSTASYVAAVLGRDIFGPEYSDLEVIVPPGVGDGVILRSVGESDEAYAERAATIKALVSARRRCRHSAGATATPT